MKAARRNLSRQKAGAVAALVASVCLIAMTARADGLHRFDIPAGALPAGLKRFSAAADIQILFDPAIAQGHVGAEVHGNLGDEAALKRLLTGSGLTYRITDAGIFVIVPAEAPKPQTLRPQAPAAIVSEIEPVETPSVVTIVGVRQSIVTAQDRKRNARQTMDSVIAEDIGKLPDNNAAEALARLTGVQVERSGGEANAVLVRGLPDVVTLVNGREVFTASSRRVAIQDFPADSLADISVYKSVTANQLEGGIAGLIDVRLHRPFDFKGAAVAGGLRGTYADQARKGDTIGSVLVSNRWQTGVGEVGALLNISDTHAHYFDSVRFNGTLVQPDADQTVSPDVGHDFVFPYLVGIYYNRGERERPSANASLQWRPDDSNDVYVDLLYQGFRNRGDADFFGNVLSDASGYSHVVLSPDGQRAQSLTATLTSRSGPAKITQLAATDTTQVAVGDAWRSGAWKVTSELAMTASSHDETNINVDTALAAGPTVHIDNFNAAGSVEYRYSGLDLSSPSAYVFSNMYDGRTGARGRSTQGKIDAVWTLDSPLIRRVEFGARLSSRKSSFYLGERRGVRLDENIPLSLVPGVDEGGLVKSGFNGSDVQQMRTWFTLSWDSIRDNLPALRDFAFGADAPEEPVLSPVSAFASIERVGAVYAQMEYRGSVRTLPVDGLIGVRLVGTDNRLYGTSAVFDATGAAIYQPTNSRRQYLEPLPSLSARLHISDTLQLRLSAGKAITWPDFNALNPAVALNSAGVGFELTGSGGNPNLEPTHSVNYDASLEYNAPGHGSASIAAFYRDIRGFVTYFATHETYNGQSAAITRPYGAGTGYLRGAEASYTTFFDFLPDRWRGFGVQANATFIEGYEALPDIPGVGGSRGVLPGVSKYSCNLIAIYERDRLSARLAYNYRSRWITNYTASGLVAREYTDAVSRLDMSVAYRLDANIRLTLDGTNLLGRPYHSYFGTPLTPRDIRFEDRLISVGLRFRY